MSLDGARIAREAAALASVAVLGALSRIGLAAADAIDAPSEWLAVALLVAATVVIVVGAATREPSRAVRHYVALVLGMLAGTHVPVPGLHRCDDAAYTGPSWESALSLLLFTTGVAMVFFCGWLLGWWARELSSSRRRRADATLDSQRSVVRG